jgi:hypothetical protein
MVALNYNGVRSPVTILNRSSVKSAFGVVPAPTGKDLHEFPYASTRQGGFARGALERYVDLSVNRRHGYHLGLFQRHELKGVAGSKFIIVPLPI